MTPPVRPSPGKLPILTIVLAGIRGAAWLGCILAVAGVCVLYVMMLGKAQGAVQEASLSAMGCLAVLVAYVLARAVDSATRWQ